MEEKQLKEFKEFEAFLLKRINNSSAGYLAACEDVLQHFSRITGRDTYDRYMEAEEAKYVQLATCE